MPDLPDTRTSLLLQIRDPDNAAAWEEFVELYQPVVYRVALSRGLQNADALDLVQTVFVAIANAIGKWEKQDTQTRFRHWLLRVARNATINTLTRQPRDRGRGGDSEFQPLEEISSPDSESSSQIHLEYRRQLYLHAAEKVRANTSPSTWKAFELTAVQGIPINAAAQDLGKSVGAVYAARSRIMKQLADIVTKLEESYQ